jgi:hypothetical protein
MRKGGGLIPRLCAARQSNWGIYDRRRAGRAPLISFVLLPFVLLDCGIISYFYLSHLR